MIPETLSKELVRQHYKVVGSHSACKVCLWTRKAIRNRGVCYKQLWYGIESHRCLQMTPNITCDQRCVFCWRVIERTALSPGLKYDEPSEIIDGCMAAQRKLLNGFPGYEGTDMKKWKEAQNPTNAAISLLGEPTLYPHLSGLIEEFHKRGMTTFLVTNGQHPEVLDKITEPTQLYISVDAPDKATLKRMDRPVHTDFWERLGKSLDAMSSMRCRKVLRLTLLKGWNMDDAKGYAKLVERSGCDFIEPKAYMHVGESQKRLAREAMPTHAEVKTFAEQLSMETGFSIKGEQPASRVVLLKR